MPIILSKLALANPEDEIAEVTASGG